MIAMDDLSEVIDAVKDHEDRIRTLEQVVLEVKALVKYAKMGVGLLAISLGTSLTDMGLI